MRQIPSLDGPRKPRGGSRGLCVGRQGGARRACGGLNLHRTAPDWPAASFNLRLSEILPGSMADFERSVWGGLQRDA